MLEISHIWWFQTHWGLRIWLLWEKLAILDDFRLKSSKMANIKQKCWCLKTSVSLKSPISLLSAILSDFRHIEVLRHANFCFKSAILVNFGEISHFWWFQTHWGFKTSTFLLYISHSWWFLTHWGFKTSTFLLEISHF